MCGYRDNSYRVSTSKWSMNSPVVKSSYPKAAACPVSCAVSHRLRLCRESTNRQKTKSRSSWRVFNYFVQRLAVDHICLSCFSDSLLKVAKKGGNPP